MLRNLCEINNEDEHSLHHNFSSKRNENDKANVNQLVSYVTQRGNPFDVNNTTLKNLATGTSFSKESSEFLLSCVKKGEESYEKFVVERMDEKSVKLFEKIPKSQSGKKKSKVRKAIDVRKETVNFVRTIDYARLRQLDVSDLLKYEITPTSFYLTKDGELRKSPKSELTRELKDLLETPCPAELPDSDLKSILVIDFMAYARKIAIKTMKLNTYEDFFQALWNTFASLSKGRVIFFFVFDELFYPRS